MVFFVANQPAQRVVQRASAKRGFVFLGSTQLVEVAGVAFLRVQLTVEPACNFLPRWEGDCLGHAWHRVPAETAAYHHGGSIAVSLPQGVPNSIDVALVWKRHGVCIPTFGRRDFVVGEAVRSVHQSVDSRLLIAGVRRRVDGFGFQDAFNITSD